MIQVQPVQTSSNGLRHGFAHNTVMGLGITQIFIGIACLALGIVTLLEKCAVYQISAPIWCGVFFLITGVIGCLSSRKKTNATIIASLVLSILSSSLGVIIMIYSELFALIKHLPCLNESSLVCYAYAAHNKVCVASSIALMVLTFIELVIATINSGFGCRTICCSQGVSPQMYYLVGESSSVSHEQIPMDDIPCTESLPQNDPPVENHDSQISTDHQQADHSTSTDQANQDD
ncbi:membrane-spanning 4-domains subfamily A member 4A-like [Saccoglossus kowalevskii]